MYYVIRTFDQTHASFASGGILWFKDLTAADPYYILPILSAVTMLAASEITAKNVDPQQRWLMRILPVGITVFLLSFPAGLFMYWITSNFVTLVQNYLIYHHGPGRKSPTGGKEREAVDPNTGPHPTSAKQRDATNSEQQKAKRASRRRRKKRR
jgi:YidC/Oxa1 family membrane protein insertase